MNDAQGELREIWYESDRTRLFAVESGSGHPIVFLHGGLADHRASWFRMRELAATRRLVMPDVRGAGRSIHAGALGWDQLADDVVALLQHLGLERAVVGGTSAGSGVALRMALRHPQRVQALLVVSPVFAGEEHALMQASRVAMERMAEAGERARTDGIAAILPLFGALPAGVREIAIEMARGFDPGSVAATTRFLASGEGPFQRMAELAALSMPTLLVPGMDPEHPAEVAERYARVIPGAVLAEPTVELASVVEGFLRSAGLDEAAGSRSIAVGSTREAEAC
jgi:pimeloyl-ACP methyl ester carboxylesterase